MRILHVFDHSLPLQSGYVSRSLSIIRSQQARGWETVQLTTPRYHRSAEGCEIIDGLKFYRCRKVAAAPPLVRELLEMQVTKKRIDEVVELEKPDILHAHSPVLTALPCLAAARNNRLPVVYEVRALWEDAAVDHGSTREGTIRYRLSRWLETRALRRAGSVVTICDGLREEISARGIQAAKITVVPNAVNRDFFNTDSTPEVMRNQLGITGRTVLAFIGSFYPYEGLDLLLEAVPALSSLIPGLLVLLVGGGPDEERLRNIVRRSGTETFVRFTGRVHHKEVDRYYSAADIMVFPRKRSRLTDLVTPLKPLEAMAQRKPVLASDVGGHRELVRDSDTGYLFPAGDVSALTRKLAAIAEDPADRARVAENGRKFVEKERTWEHVVDRYAQVYADLISGAGRLNSGGASTI